LNKNEAGPKSGGILGRGASREGNSDVRRIHRPACRNNGRFNMWGCSRRFWDTSELPENIDGR
jgi:hypothetical protein